MKQQPKIKYYVSGAGYIYSAVDNRIYQMLLASNGQWTDTELHNRDVAYAKFAINLRPISPLAVKHFIEMGGYNHEGLI